ncbi:beta-glucosidase 11-like [Humulus lupulus]|uniref:beta-glucosidase 11-like n=1 Tax=Humulus lupulus TaxID=3486 RepID=UPI002B400868|nr:beta-glucosidase 11-like [Humulus lupulus]
MTKMLDISLYHIFVLCIIAVAGICYATEYSRNDFPVNFIFGSGTTSYQVEGAANEDGRTASIWDTFAHAGYSHEDTGDIACDQYDKYKEDVKLMADMGLDAYRFSISWSRLIPNGRGPVNPKGLEYYNNLINELLKHGIQPHVTLVNYDHPQALEDEYGGWVSRKMVEDFIQYADVCFKEFGDRVQYWTPVNEPNIFGRGYDEGIVPPQRCSPPFGVTNCTRGNSSTEPYLVVHHILLAQASVVRLYRKNYQAKQHGFIGLSIYTSFNVPYTYTKQDIIATQRANDFLFGWVLEPLVFGDYPKIMKQNAGSRIPSFTKLESEMVKGAFDFIGVIHYYNIRIKDNPVSLLTELRDYSSDQALQMMGYDPMTDSEFPINPWGLEGVLEYIKQSYGNPPVFVYENGQRMPRISSLEDTPRVEYLQAYIGGVLNAMRNGSNTRGYFAWSFLDVLELFNGFDTAYGLVYVDIDDPELKRYPKLSAHWYSRFLNGKTKVNTDQVIKSKDNLSHLPS